VIPNHPTHGRVEYRRPAEIYRGHVKLHVDERFLLKSRRLKGCAPHQIDRRTGQVGIGILQRFGIQHAAVLRVQDGVNDYRLEES